MDCAAARRRNHLFGKTIHRCAVPDDFKRFPNVTVGSHPSRALSTEPPNLQSVFAGPFAIILFKDRRFVKIRIRKRQIDNVFPLTFVCLHFQWQTCLRNYRFDIKDEFGFVGRRVAPNTNDLLPVRSPDLVNFKICLRFYRIHRSKRLTTEDFSLPECSRQFFRTDVFVINDRFALDIRRHFRENIMSKKWKTRFYFMS